MILPNFFIIGAPKAGTTALYDMIKQRPEIYVSPRKSPRFFSAEGEPPLFPGPSGDSLHRWAVWKPREYAMLFAGVKNQRAIGEASVGYLRSPLAAQRIHQYLPQSRIIAILRQPAERAYSHYTYMRQHKREPARTFKEALEQEQTRIKDGWISGYYYKTNGLYHAQLSIYYDLFPREQIKILSYDDLKTSPQTLLRDLFRFLEVDEIYTPELRRSNVTLYPRSERLHNLATHPTRIQQLTPFLPAFARSALLSALRRADSKFNLIPPPSLDLNIRARLTNEYREDILKLQDLVRRDFSHWLA